MGLLNQKLKGQQEGSVDEVAFHGARESEIDPWDPTPASCLLTSRHDVEGTPSHIHVCTHTRKINTCI